MDDVSGEMVFRRIVEELKGARSVVDLGGDGGQFVAELKAGAPDKVCVLVDRVAKERLGADRVVETHPEVFVEDDKWAYDAIVCRDVLGQVDDLGRFLQGVYARLKPGGKAIFAGALGEKMWKNAFTLDPEFLDRYLERAGFSVKKDLGKSLIFVIGTKKLVDEDEAVI